MRLIDGDEAIEKVQDIEPIFIFKVTEVIATQRTSDVIAMLENAPTIEAEPVKHGRWEWHNEDGWYYSCSVCGHNAYGNTDNIVSGLWAYCPRCGAKLDLPGEKL